MKQLSQTNTMVLTDPDYGATMLLDSTARTAEIAALRNSLKNSPAAGDQSSTDLVNGVSVIIPSYRGRDRILVTLQSLIEQALDPASFEIVLVINGEDDGTFGLVTSLREAHPEHNFRILYQSKPSAGAARNLGIMAATFRYLTFLDDDDYVGTAFLSALLESAAPNTVSVAPIINVSSMGEEDLQNALNLQITARGSKTFKFNAVSSILGFNACKLIPTAAARRVSYSEGLRSGEDICFMAKLAVTNNFDAVVASNDASAAYYRVLRDESISRQPLDFDFAVQQRLEVISELEAMRSWDSSANDVLVSGLIRSQSNFVRRYLDEHPQDRAKVVDSVESFDFKDFPWAKINEGTARDLVISYCFAPYSDTSAVIAAKAVVERGNVVDVIYNNMSAVRRKDNNLEAIAGRFVDAAIEVNAPASFSGWSQISEFVEKGIAIADRRDALIGGYRSVYSRVLWPGSHFLAALFKIRHSGVTWTAEFSDPLSTDANGSMRRGDLVRDEAFEVLRRAVTAKGFPALETDSLFTWCEYLTYILADELVFTNTNQLSYMLDHVSDKRLRKMIEKKATVRVHPTLPPRSYRILPSKYPLSEAVVNIAYFGAFYENRGLHEVLTALANSSPEVRRRLRLHVFTNKPDELEGQIHNFGLAGVVKSQGYRPYLEFLNLATQFDVLLVNDVERTGEMSINPFLPSKYSDYKGADKPIWGLVDEGSALSRESLAYMSRVGDGPGALGVINQIHRSRFPSTPRQDLEAGRTGQVHA
ncbi:Glycosyl transferase family 2 [Pseudarthrobacter enclensis]|uniref:Glycosyltransferase 2-like domain-containing protein n=1 Tax=Pseudarthrobacter enclensis TaxID=993070 RepID=A0A0V8IVF3_9MICC|nr:glycosyltransferase [Pseudarthrobacter enclensis]KSU78679.1 hypothetical protein AS031_01085 [Pseudarthrobacter enclensis]SCB75096.1 Glycosyl transferase family 2 [Pseudarthrobacter enclensis]